MGPGAYGPSGVQGQSPWPSLSLRRARRSVASLIQEPGSPLRLIDKRLQHASRSNVIVLVDHAVRLAHPPRQVAIVLAQFGKHVLRRDERGVIIRAALVARYLADRV